MTAVLKGFGRRPFAGARGSTRGRRSKASVRRKPRGGARFWLGGTYGDLKVADGSNVWLRGPEAPSLIAGSEDDELVRFARIRGPGVSPALGEGEWRRTPASA